MEESQKGNLLKSSWIVAKALVNGVAMDSEGNTVKLRDCAIDTKRIATLGEYLADNKNETKEIDFDSQDDTELAKRFVIPVTLPNGQEVEVIVNQDGQDEACIFRDEAGNEKKFELTPRMKEAIEKRTPENLKEVIGEEAYRAGFLPDTLEDYAEKVQKDELLPKNQKQAAFMVGIGNNGETEKEGKEQQGQLEKEREESEKEVPAEARDAIAKICSEHNLDIKDLKEVMEVEPEVIADNLENTGIKENNGRVYCLRFRDGERLNGRVVMVQGEKAVDDRKYDDYMNDYMDEHKGQKRVKEVECEHDKIAYTDLHGNTTLCEITKEPRDISCSEKELLQVEMEKLNNAEEQIQNADMPLENKMQELIKINQKRLDLFKEYGVEVPLVENEIQADMEISEEVEDYAEERSEEIVAQSQEDEEQEDDGWGHERLTPAEEAMQRRGF